MTQNGQNLKNSFNDGYDFMKNMTTSTYLSYRPMSHENCVCLNKITDGNCNVINENGSDISKKKPKIDWLKSFVSYIYIYYMLTKMK